MTAQILLGSLLLVICSIFHVLILIGGIKLLASVAAQYKGMRNNVRIAMSLGITIGVIVFAHTVQIWIWAFSFIILGAIPDLVRAVYFSLVTYTTLGYGDVTLGEGMGIYAAMAAVTGLLNFGLSTAFLVGVFGKILPADLLK